MSRFNSPYNKELNDKIGDLSSDVSQRGVNLLKYSKYKVAIANDFDWKPAIDKAVSELADGDVLFLPNQGFYQSTVWEVTKPIKILGAYRPSKNGTELEKGSYLYNNGIAIRGTKNVWVTNLGIKTPNANGIEINGAATSDVTINNCIVIARDHCYLFQSNNGLVKNIHVIDCEAHNAIHGFISKAEDVTYTNCRAFNCTTNGFGIISDNLVGTVNAMALANKVINCKAENCYYAINFYCRDTKSSNNASGMKNSGHIINGFIAKGCTIPYRIADPVSAQPAGQTYIAPANIVISNIQEIGSVTYSLEINQCKNVTISDFALEKEMNILTAYAENLNLKNLPSDLSRKSSYFDLIPLPTGVTPSVKSGTGVFTTNSNGTITNLLDGKEEKIITILFKDDTTVINNGGSFNLSRVEYKGSGSFLILKYQSGVWYEIAGNCVSKGTFTKNLPADASAIDLKKGHAIDIFGTGTTTNTIKFTNKNPDNEVISVVIRSSGGAFTFGGFDSNFVVPSDFPLTVNFGTAIMSQWVYMNSISKWVCISRSTAPYV